MKATWIWYPSDFEVWLGNKFHNRRTERGAIFPPFWKQDSHWSTVVFTNTYELEKEEAIAVWTEGEFSFSLDGRLLSELSAPDHSIWHEEVGSCKCYRIRIPAGTHELTFKVWNLQSPPALFVDGDTIKSSPRWKVTYEDKIWIDEDGVAHGSGVYVPAASWNFDEPDKNPSRYTLEWCEQQPVRQQEMTCGTLYDFGRETFGHLDFRKTSGSGVAHIYYGESRLEALDREHCETLDMVEVVNGRLDRNPGSKAFRYVYIEPKGDVGFQLVMQEEYAPFDPEKSGSFRCSDEELNRIWQVSARTLELTTQEFFMDGIKRDRWVWSGDAIQSYLMNYYLHFDSECVKRTIRQLRGKDPITSHVNTIMDYTFFWIISVQQYHFYTGDAAFVEEMFPRMVTLMDYALARTDDNGMASGKEGDWVFVDWTDFPMSRKGALCFEQLLLWHALACMVMCAYFAKKPKYMIRYHQLAKELKAKIDTCFWDDGLHAFAHALEDGKLNRQVTRFPNIIAILYNTVTPEQRQQIVDHVLLNPDVPPITTPYMRFYELEALCKTGHHEKALHEIRDYWGGMLHEGATSFWEKYNPEEKGAQHYAMYGRPYGKSLCHAWGASPLYLLGRYFLGVRPTSSGYKDYEVRPVPAGLEWMEGDVPTPFGRIHVSVTPHEVIVVSDGGTGKLTVGEQEVEIPALKEVRLKR